MSGSNIWLVAAPVSHVVDSPTMRKMVLVSPKVPRAKSFWLWRDVH